MQRGTAGTGPAEFGPEAGVVEAEIDNTDSVAVTAAAVGVVTVHARVPAHTETARTANT